MSLLVSWIVSVMNGARKQCLKNARAAASYVATIACAGVAAAAAIQAQGLDPDRHRARSYKAFKRRFLLPGISGVIICTGVNCIRLRVREALMDP